MEQKEQRFNIPQIRVYNNYGHMYGYFGNYPIYDSALDYSLKYMRDYHGPMLKDICFGPFINFEEIEGLKTRSVDDFLVVCDEEKNVIKIYDQITLDNKPRKINWFNRDDKQQPIVFEPRLRLFAVQKVVEEPMYRSPDQSVVENMCFNIIQDMGFDDCFYKTKARFFKPLPRYNSGRNKGQLLKNSILPDSAFLIKTGKNFYSWYKIYSEYMAFEVIYFKDGDEHFRSKISDTKDLIAHLKEDRERRNNYIKWQYAR